MRKATNFVLFQAGWFACVLPAADGDPWTGALVTLGIVVIHLLWVAEHRRRDLVYILLVGALGTALDSALHVAGLLQYPGTAEAWSLPIVPPWIIALWVLFATLPGHSMA